MGDYHYREKGCPAGQPCGYNWASWQADFFDPAAASQLLNLAPWILVRGNHEGCNPDDISERAWRGYLLFFDPAPEPQWPAQGQCPADIPPYKLALDDLDLFVVDTSSKNPERATADFAWVRAQLSAERPAWLATHVPTEYLKPALSASHLDDAASLDWLLVGHDHLFKHIARAQSGHQPETIVGGGGTELSDCTTDGIANYSDCYDRGYSWMEVHRQTRESWHAVTHMLDSGGKTYTFSIPAAPG